MGALPQIRLGMAMELVTVRLETQRLQTVPAFAAKLIKPASLDVTLPEIGQQEDMAFFLFYLYAAH